MQIIIKALQRKQQPSTKNPGQTYTVTKILALDGKTYSGIGKWTENWKENDTIEANVIEKTSTGPDGFPVTYYNLVDPAPQNIGGMMFKKRSNLPLSYELAIQVIVNNLDEISLDTVARRIKNKLDED